MTRARGGARVVGETMTPTNPPEIARVASMVHCNIAAVVLGNIAAPPLRAAEPTLAGN
jgi:hypothetical protein